YIFVQSGPRSPGISRAIESAARGGHILSSSYNKHVVDIIMQSVTAFRPCFASVFTHMHAANLNAHNNSFRCIGMYIYTTNMGLITVARKPPGIPRRQIL